MDMHLWKSRNVETIVMSYLGISEYGWPMEEILGMPLPLTALPKVVKGGNKGDICFT